MGIFSKKTVATATKVVKVSAETLGAEIDNLTKSFTTLSVKLRNKAAEAQALKESKEAEIAALQTECAGLEAVNNRASGIADKIDGFFN